MFHLSLVASSDLCSTSTSLHSTSKLSYLQVSDCKLLTAKATNSKLFFQEVPGVLPLYHFIDILQFQRVSNGPHFVLLELGSVVCQSCQPAKLT
jgi:hypothetical protein